MPDWAADFSDDQFEKAGGARVVHSNEEVSTDVPTSWCVKVNKPEPAEYDLIREGQAIMSFLHLAVADPGTGPMCSWTARCTAIDLGLCAG